MDVLIRDAAASDLEALEALEKACFSVPWTREQLQSQLPDERHEFLVASDERELVRQMLRRAGERGLAFVTLEVRAHNEGAIALYAGEGFLPAGLRKDYYERPKEDALLMTRFF